MIKIVLIGYMGVGKSTIAKLLSEKIGLKSVDTDVFIENNEQLSINEIFDKKGEIYFRKKEHETFRCFLENNESLIISVGGGTPCYSNNHEFLKLEKVISIYLKASIETLHNRLINQNTNRPLLANQSEEGLKELIAKNLFDRSFFYNQAKNTIVVDGKSPSAIVDEIEKLLNLIGVMVVRFKNHLYMFF